LGLSVAEGAAASVAAPFVVEAAVSAAAAESLHLLLHAVQQQAEHVVLAAAVAEQLLHLKHQMSLGLPKRPAPRGFEQTTPFVLQASAEHSAS
jgi:hypothetical protein